MAYDLNGLFIRVHHHLKTIPLLTLVELSSRISVERHTIEKSVKLATGQTFRKMRNELLLAHAKHLLDANPNHSIKEVAFKLGYRSQRSFSRFMRSASGCSPKEFRRARPNQSPE